jgi:hypothetical protein
VYLRARRRVEAHALAAATCETVPAMRPFFLEPIFWRSVAHAVLRFLGISRNTAYRVMVRAEPVWLRDVQTGKRQAFGLYTTRIVMACSDADARAAAVEQVRREAVLAVAGNATETPPAFEVEEIDALGGVAWRQGRGFTLYRAE